MWDDQITAGVSKIALFLCQTKIIGKRNRNEGSLFDSSTDRHMSEEEWRKITQTLKQTRDLRALNRQLFVHMRLLVHIY